MPSELAQTFDEGFEFYWVGSAERGAQELAERIGYQFQVEGNRPEADVIASVRGVPTKTVFDVFQDIGLQSAPFAMLILDARERLVRYSYDRRGPTGTTQDFVGSPQPLNTPSGLRLGGPGNQTFEGPGVTKRRR